LQPRFIAIIQAAHKEQGSWMVKIPKKTTMKIKQRKAERGKEKMF